MSDEIRIGTGQALRAVLIVVVSAAATVAACIGAYRLGFETSRAQIYEQQFDRAEQRTANALALVGVVDQAKGREVASCQASGRSDCLATVGGAL